MRAGAGAGRAVVSESGESGSDSADDGRDDALDEEAEDSSLRSGASDSAGTAVSRKIGRAEKPPLVKGGERDRPRSPPSGWEDAQGKGASCLNH